MSGDKAFRRQQPMQVTAAMVKDLSSSSQQMMGRAYTELAESLPVLRKALRGQIGIRRTALALVPMRVAIELTKQGSAHCAATWWAYLRAFHQELWANMRAPRKKVKR